MSIMLICTLGSRDLLLSDKMVKPARTEGEKIFRDYENLKSQLTYPIVKKALNHIFERHERIDRLVFVATNQDPAVTSQKYLEHDTVEFARIISSLIKDQYGHNIKEIKTCNISKDPAYLDSMFKFFEENFFGSGACNNAFKIDNLDICYVEQTGGIPAANMALLYQSINRFKDKCKILYVTETSNVAFSLEISNIILDEKRKSLLPHLAKNYDYASLSAHLDEKKEDEKFLLRLCQYARHMLYFDVDKARIIANDAMGEFCEKRHIFEELISGLQGLENKNHESLILELFYNMQIKYHRQEFVDFLGRIYRFEEAVLRYLVEREFNISTELDRKTNTYPELSACIENTAGLKVFIKTQKTPDGGKIDPEIVALPLLNAMLNFAVVERNEKHLQIVHNIFNSNKKFALLIKIRNKSIIGHGFEGVSEKIRQKYEGDILEDLKSVVKAVLEKSDAEIQESPFEKINSILIEKISRL